MTGRKDFDIHRDLIERCRRGDERAQFEIYRLYYKAMYNTSLRMLNSATEAEDVMQEAFLSAFVKISAYRGEMTFGAWLKRIVVNKTIDHIRQNKGVFEDLDNRSEPVDNDYLFQTDNEEEQLRLVQHIKEGVSMLPEGFRIVLTLSLFEGYDHEEIAQILGITESTSRSQLARAKQKLIEWLKK